MIFFSSLIYLLVETNRGFFHANKREIKFCNSRSDYDDDGGQHDESTHRDFDSVESEVGSI